MSKSPVVAVTALVVPVVALAFVIGPAAVAAARDRDRDRLPDRWERRHGLSLKRNSARRDPDGDRLRNRREYRLRLNPRRADTDGDGLRDRAELRRWRTNPRRADTDRDGFKDGEEILAGTDPRDRRSHPGARPTPPGPIAPAPGTPAAPAGFPSPSTTGVPAGWVPTQVRTTNLHVTQPGALVQDVLFADGADLLIGAPNVTVRRVKLEGGWINNGAGSTCGSGLLVEEVSITRTASGAESGSGQEGVISYGGYTARRVQIMNRSEGLRVSSCGPVTIDDSFVKLEPPEPCGDWHGDGIQGYGGSGLTVRNVTIDTSDHTTLDGRNCWGTAPFFYRGVDQGNTGRVEIDRLMVEGMGYPFRLGMPASVTGLKIVNNSWVFGPILAKCSIISPWEAKIVTRDASYQPTTVRDQPCSTEAIG